MRVAYVRVSTDQLHQVTSVERQRTIFKQMGCDLILEEYETGTNTLRPQYQKLIKMITMGEVQEVVAARSDRLNRNKEDMQYFYDLCLELGVAWTFTDEPELNSTSTFADDLRTQKAYEAQMESERIGRRQKRYYAYAESSGNAIARVKTLGYRIIKRKYEIDNVLPDLSNVIGNLDGKPVARGEIARRLIEFYLEHKTLRYALKHWKDYLAQLDTTTGNPSEVNRLMRFASNSFQEWLRNPVLRGHTAYGKNKKTLFDENLQKLDEKKYAKLPPHEWRIQFNTHPDQALMTDAEWVTIEKLLDTNKTQGYAIAKSRAKPGTPASLSPILRCRDCNLTFRSVSSTFKSPLKTIFYRYYYCCGKNNHHCNSRNLKEPELVQQIIDAIFPKAQELADAILRGKSGVTATPDQIKFLQQEAEEADRKYQLSGMTEFRDMHKKLLARIALIEATRAKEVMAVEQNAKLLTALASLDYWQSLTPLELHQDLRDIVKDCWIQNGRVVDVTLALRASA